MGWWFLAICLIAFMVVWACCAAAGDDDYDI